MFKISVLLSCLLLEAGQIFIHLLTFGNFPVRRNSGLELMGEIK